MIMNIVIDPAFNHLKEFIHHIPVLFLNEENTIYEARNTLKLVDVEGQKLVVKSFKIPHFINKIAYSYLRASKAKRSYEYGLEIIRRGINIPVPVAYMEEFRWGLLYRSYYVSGYSDYLLMRHFHFTKKLTAEDVEILKAFAGFTALLHEKEIYHTDYSPGNILYKKEGETVLFHLIDVNRMQFKKVTEKMAYKSFQRMDFSVEMLEIVAGEYALQRGMNIDKCIVEVKRRNLKTMRKYR